MILSLSFTFFFNRNEIENYGNSENSWLSCSFELVTTDFKNNFFIFILFFLRSVHIILGGSRKLKFKINSIIFSVIKTKCVTTTIQL